VLQYSKYYEEMSANPPFAIPNPGLRFKLFTLLLLISFTLCPVNSRPSTSVDSPLNPHVHHQNTDIVPQQSEDMGNENKERIIPEVNPSGEQETEDESEGINNEPADPEDYPQQDMPAVPMGEAAGNNGGRKAEAKHPKPYHSGKGGRRNGVDHHSVAKPVQEGNDTNDGIPEDLQPEQLNKSLDNGDAANTTSEESYMKLSKNNRER
jgi:hypothetical protein